MNAIQNLERDLTGLITAHRVKTVKNCDIIVELDCSRVVAQGTYENLLKNSPRFLRTAQAVI